MSSDKSLIDFQHLLSAYFRNDGFNRFKLEKKIGSGAESMAWQVSYKPFGEQCQRLVLKHHKRSIYYDINFIESGSPDANERSDQSLDLERKWLNVRHTSRKLLNSRGYFVDSRS
jgi:hypothetical protein